MGTSMKLSRRSFLGGLGMAFAAGLPARASTTGPRNLILVYAKGGWDPTWVFDPKPESPYVSTGEGDYGAFGDGALWLDESRPSVTSFFERYGSVSAVINGLNVPAVAHQSCANRVFTGHRDLRRPDVGAIAGHELGETAPIPYLVLGNTAFAGDLGVNVGFNGRRNQLRRLVVEKRAYEPPTGQDWHRHFLELDEEELVHAFVSARAQQVQETRGAAGINNRRVEDFLLGLERSHQLSEFEDFFSTGGSQKFPDQASQAAEALHSGLSRAVQLSIGSGFDTHDDNDQQSDLFEEVFDGMLSLMETLEATEGENGSLLDETVVWLFSEMGRTPLLNDDAGKDHWPYTSCLITGAGVRGEAIIGSTDETQVGEACNMETGEFESEGALLQSENTIAGILELLSAQPDVHFPDVEVLRAFHA